MSRKLCLLLLLVCACGSEEQTIVGADVDISTSGDLLIGVWERSGPYGPTQTLEFTSERRLLVDNQPVGTFTVMNSEILLLTEEIETIAIGYRIIVFDDTVIEIRNVYNVGPNSGSYTKQ